MLIQPPSSSTRTTNAAQLQTAALGVAKSQRGGNVSDRAAQQARGPSVGAYDATYSSSTRICHTISYKQYHLSYDMYIYDIRLTTRRLHPSAVGAVSLNLEVAAHCRSIPTMVALQLLGSMLIRALSRVSRRHNNTDVAPQATPWRNVLVYCLVAPSVCAPAGPGPRPRCGAGMLTPPPPRAPK